MTDTNFELVRKSWAVIAKINFEVIGGIFYMRLFEVSPELQPLFRQTSMKEQSIRLGCMLSYVIAKFDNLPVILDEVRSLAERHRKYGATETHYKLVGDALIWTLEQGLGEYWNEPLQQAWLEFYQSLSDVMLGKEQQT